MTLLALTFDFLARSTRSFGAVLPCSQFSISQGSCRLQEPVDDFLQLFCGWLLTGGCLVPFGVVDGASHDVELVVQLVEFVLGDDEFRLVEL